MTHNPNKSAQWRSEFGMTEHQAGVVVALIAARSLGYDGATTEELVEIGACWLGSSRMCDLVKLRMVECVGRTEKRGKIWAPTAAAYRRFGVQARTKESA